MTYHHRRTPHIAAFAVLASLSLAGCHSGGNPTKGSGSSSKSSDSGSSSTAGSDSKSGGADSSSSSKETSVPIDTVKIAPEDQGRAGIQVAPVTVRAMAQTFSVPGEVALNDRSTHHMGALANGRIVSVAVLPGDPVHRGQLLATMHSDSVHETVAALTQAFAALDRAGSAVRFATQLRDRYAKLYSIQASSLEEKQRSEQDLAQAEKDRADAEASVHAEREHLSELLQVPPETLTPGNLANRELMPVRSLDNGVVITRNITPGQVVNMGDDLLTTANLSTVWVNASVNQADLSHVRLGAPAQVTLQADPGHAMRGTVASVGDMLDPQTRTLPVRLALPNPETRLRPNMFVTASIAEPGTRTAIFVPTGALQDVNGFRVVFVTNDGTNFQARAVRTSTESNGMVEVTDGLAPTDHVVSSGAFMVKGELLKGTVGEG